MNKIILNGLIELSISFVAGFVTAAVLSSSRQ